MASKNLSELELELKKLREKEARVKEELALKRKAADAKARKELARKKCVFADLFIEQFGEKVLDFTEEMEFFISLHIEEVNDLIASYGKQE